MASPAPSHAALRQPASWILFALAAVAVFRTRLNGAWVILAGGLLGAMLGLRGG